MDFLFEIPEVWVSFLKSFLKVLYLFNVLESSRMIQEVLELSRKLKNVPKGSKKFQNDSDYSRMIKKGEIYFILSDFC